MATSHLLLMRHGAGIKPGQDPATTPPGPDQILTANGFRNAQAVGQQLADTLATSRSGPMRVGCIWYGGPDNRGRRWVPRPGTNREPEATARVVADQLIPMGLWAGEPEAWPDIAPAVFPASSLDAATKAREAAACLTAKASEHPGEALLVVGNSPQVDWIAEQFLGRAIAVGRGEVVCLSGPHCRWRWSLRRPRRPLWDLHWTVGPSEETTIKDLLEKIRSKMDAAKFLGTFITALVTFVLGKRFDALKAAADRGQRIPALQDRLWLVTVVLLATAALLCFAALFYYDGLLMPTRYWTSRARRSRTWPAWLVERPWLGRLVGWPRRRWLVERPPSSAAWVLQQNMLRVWNRLVVPAICVLGLALLVFALLALVDPRTVHNLLRPELFLVGGVVVALATVYLRSSRPRLGVQD